MVLNGQKICRYYEHIDINDIDWVMSLFSKDAIYYRADSVYEGYSAIDNFFRKFRQIRGCHSIDVIWSFDEKVICTGIFKGQGREGDSRSVRFSDFWLFNSSGLVTKRETFLALGHQYVKE